MYAATLSFGTRTEPGEDARHGTRVTKRQQAEEPPPPVVHVEISAGGHQVVVEAAAPLHVVKKAALELFRATDSPDITRAAGGYGFAGEIAPAGELPPDLTLPARIVPWGDV